jgi:type VI secretion system secreted protein VgrG
MPSSSSRQLSIALPGGVEADIERFEAVERLSELFQIDVQVRCVGPVDFFALLGQPVEITIAADGEQGRIFHGLLFEAEFIEDQRPVIAADVLGTGVIYRLTLRPWTYYLTRNLDYVIFQDMTALDIIQQVFTSLNFQDFDASGVQRGKRVRSYCAQFRETAFDFVSRLMEEEGIYYFFTHTEGKHTLTMCDNPAAHSESAYGTVPYVPLQGGNRAGQDYIWRWTQRVVETGETKATLRNFDFKRPTSVVEVAHPFAKRGTGPAGLMDVYDYPAAFGVISDHADGTAGDPPDPQAGEVLGKVIVDARRRDNQLFLGEGDTLALACGETFELQGHSVSSLNGKVMIVSLRHEVVSETYRSGGGGGGGGGATMPTVFIEAVPSDVPWQAPQRTPRPVARGPETAIVTGPAGEEIYTDEFGRVKVHFHWDRLGPVSGDSKTSCWLRVASSLAGNNFGELFLPRVGQEVIVDFLDGDPDRPLITGRVYNGDQRTSVGKLPDNRTKSGLRTQTAYGKSTSDYDGAVGPPSDEPGFNEILFEDRSGKELFSVRAQRDMLEHVYRDETRNTHRDQTEEVGRHRKTTIHTGNDTYTLEKGDETHTVSQGKRTTQVQQNEALKVVQGDMSTEVSQGNQSTKVSMGNQTTDVSMGNISVKADMGKIEIEAMQSIELKVGQSSIMIDQTGVTVKGMMISNQAQVQMETKGMMSQHTADVMMTVKGAIVMIN